MEYVEHDIFSNFLNLNMHEDEIVELGLWHLDLVVHMFAQPLYIIDVFTYDDAIIVWINEKKKEGFSS